MQEYEAKFFQKFEACLYFICTRPDEWTWKQAAPADWTPSVRTVDGGLEVEYYTYSGLMPEGVHRHRDRYPVGNYRAVRLDDEIGQGPGGYLH